MSRIRLHGPAALAVLAGIVAFGAGNTALALAGAGLPFILASVLASVAAGAVIYAALPHVMAPPPPLQPPPPPPPPPDHGLAERLRAIEARNIALRHDLRGVLSPALMMTDRLLKSDDPAMRRAGEAVLRSVQRATDLLAANKAQDAGSAAAPVGPAAVSPPPR